jgi:replication initiation protein RepC
MTHLTKWNLLRAVEEAREPLALKANALNILRALVSFIPGDTIAAAPDQHICFASNDTLASRAHVSVKTVERHISALVEAGLIKRASALNGKRWARRDGQGRAVVISGLSLAPLLQRHQEIKRLAEEHAKIIDRLHQLKDQCRVLLGQIRQIPELINRARNILRRRPDEQTLTCLLKDLTDNLRDSDGEIEGHKEPISIPEVGQSDIEEAFPRLCAELRTSRSNEECQERMDDIARQVGLGTIWAKARQTGPQVAFMLLGYVLQRIERIDHPSAYMGSLIQKLKLGSMTPNQLLGSNL